MRKQNNLNKFITRSIPENRLNRRMGHSKTSRTSVAVIIPYDFARENSATYCAYGVYEIS